MGMNPELRRKLMAEEPLTLEESLQLEAHLAQSGTLSQMVADLPDDEPSIAWRSQLNDRLREMAPKPKAKRLWLPIGLSSVAAAAAAVIIFMPKGSAVPPTVANDQVGSLEEAVVRGHNAGESAIVLGVANPNRGKKRGFDWSKLERS
jgi:hypothetical protein